MSGGASAYPISPIHSRATAFTVTVTCDTRLPITCVYDAYLFADHWRHKRGGVCWGVLTFETTCRPAPARDHGLHHNHGWGGVRKHLQTCHPNMIFITIIMGGVCNRSKRWCLKNLNCCSHVLLLRFPDHVFGPCGHTTSEFIGLYRVSCPNKRILMKKNCGEKKHLNPSKRDETMKRIIPSP